MNAKNNQANLSASNAEAVRKDSQELSDADLEMVIGGGGTATSTISTGTWIQWGFTSAWAKWNKR